MPRNTGPSVNGWQRLDEIIAIEDRLSQSTHHRVQLCDKCRTTTYSKSIKTLRENSCSGDGAVAVGMLSSLLIKQDWCDICNFVVRICQANLSDSDFECILRSGHILSLVRIPVAQTLFWRDIYLQQNQEIHDQNLLNGQNASKSQQMPDIPLVTRLGVGPYGTKPSFLDCILWEETPAINRGLLTGVSQPDSMGNSMCSGQILGWINKCRNSHGEACNQGTDSIHAPILVIDVHSRQIHPLVGGEQFAALSYVWGRAANCKSSSDGNSEQLPSRACQTVEDAIVVARQLGLQYLWVDRYCIATEPEEKYTQIRHMSEVYGAAYITIIALEGISCESGLPGVSMPLQRINIRRKIEASMLVGGKVLDPIQGSNKTTWKTRAWTLQEAAMSRRRLGFLNDMIFLECNEELFLDYLNTELIPQPIKPCLRLDGVSYGSNISRGCWSLENYSSLIEDYTTRKLTFQSDALAAIEGILAHITKSKGIQFLWGHPVSEFAYSLLWTCTHSKCSPQPKISISGSVVYPRPTRPIRNPIFRNEGEEWAQIFGQRLNHQERLGELPCASINRRREFPSWSWAGWQESVIFPFKVLGSIENQGRQIIAVRCGTNEHGSYFQEKEKIILLEHSSSDDRPVKLRTFVGKLQFIDHGQGDLLQRDIFQEEVDLIYEHDDVGQEILAKPEIRDVELALIVQWRPCGKNGDPIYDNGHDILVTEIGPDSIYSGNLNEGMKQHFQACEHNLILVMCIVREQDGTVRRGKLFRISPFHWARSVPKEEVIEML
jgi:hypothetical protein